MASFCTVYFDESGTHSNSEAAVVAGFLSNETQWVAFSQKWQQVLADSGLEYFRMSQFENRRGPFVGWTKDKREELLNKLLPIIHDHTFRSIGCVVMKKSFDTILSGAAKLACGDAYGLAALGCWRHLSLVLQEADVWMDCLMEDGAKGKGAIQDIFEAGSKRPKWREDHRIRLLSFQQKRVAPLQAADILAYELYKQGLQQSGLVKKRQMRHPLKELEKIEHQWHYFSDTHLKEYNDDVTRQLEGMGIKLSN